MLTFTPYASSSKGNVYTVTDKYTTVMLDCGLPWAKIKELTGFNTSSIAGICISHKHNDHCAGLEKAMKSGIDIFMLKETRRSLNLKGHRIKEISTMKEFKIGTFVIKAFPLKHDVVNCGYLICNQQGEKMIYITDSAYCEYIFPPLTIIAIECNYQKELLKQNIADGNIPKIMEKRLLQSHFELENVIKLLNANNLSRLFAIYLLHMSENNCNTQEAKKAIQEVTGKPVYVC